MALSRLALRLATLESLRPSASVADNGPWPTLAAAYVFDGKLDPIDDLDANERRATAVVYTEEDNGEPAQKAGGPPFNRRIDLVVEMAMVALLPVDENTYSPGIPYTDGELDASLDLLEAQVRFALFYGTFGATASFGGVKRPLWRGLTANRVTEIHSLSHRSSEESARLAMRSLRMKCTVPDDQFDPAPAAEPTGNDRLPDPLKSVVNALAAGCYGAKLGAGIATAAPVMPVATALKTVTFDLQPAAPPAPLDASKPQIDASADNLDAS